MPMDTMPLSVRLLAVVTAISCAGCAAPLRPVTTVRPTSAIPAAAAGRAGGVTPARVGVAFGGGSAHVGVIRWFEEHRIPIDVAAGTSMGGLVGGAFATGMDAGELEAFITSVDWDELFGDSSFEF